MVLSDVLAEADCEQVLLVHDRAARATLLVAVHDTRLGPAHGGIRRFAYPDLEAAAREVLMLARAMTWKCALAEVPAGGGKCVLLDHPGLDRKLAYRAVGRAVAQFGGKFFTGPDVGTADADLREVAAETPFVMEPPPPPVAQPALEPPAPAPPAAEPEVVASAPVAEARAAPRPAAPAALGTLELDVKPFAAVLLNGKPWHEELIGIRRFPLRAGHYVLEFKHPRRSVTKAIDITPNQVTQVPFRALETQ